VIDDPELFIRIAIQFYGNDGCLVIPRYREVLSGMPRLTKTWGDVIGDDLLLFMEAVDPNEVLNLDDVREMEKKAKDGKFN